MTVDPATSANNPSDAYTKQSGSASFLPTYNAATNALTGANQTLVTLSGEVSLSAAGITGAEFATGLGEAKFALDALTYFSSLAGCAAGVIR